MKTNRDRILKSLDFNRMLDNTFSDDMLGDILNESIEFEHMWLTQQAIDKGLITLDEAKAVTFGGKTFPDSGWCLVMAGGAGSGKGTAIQKQILLDAKILDVDAMKTLFAKVSAKDGNTKIAQHTGGRVYDFKNSDDVSDLHAIIGTELGLDDKATSNLLKSQYQKSRLDNVIFDITGKSSTKLMNIATTTKKLGYRTSLVWVVTNRQVAMMRNLLRSRVVGERLFHEIHHQVNKVLLDFLQSSDAKDYDEAWILFSSIADTTELSKEAKEKLFKNSVFKLTKSGSKFEIPPQLMEDIVTVLGAEEANPNEPSTYKSFTEVESELNANKRIDPEDGKKKVMGYGKFNFLKI